MREGDKGTYRSSFALDISLDTFAVILRFYCYCKTY